MKTIRIFHMKVFIFLVIKFSIYLNRRVFVMVRSTTGSNVVNIQTVVLLTKRKARYVIIIYYVWYSSNSIKTQ